MRKTAKTTAKTIAKTTVKVSGTVTRILFATGFAVALLTAFSGSLATAATATTAAASAGGPAGEGLFVDVDHLIFSAGDGALAVSEMVSVANKGKGPADLRIALPDGYTSLTMKEGLEAAKTTVKGNELVAAGVVPPGQSSRFAISYGLPWDKLGSGLAKKVLYPTGNLYILAEEPGVSAAAVGLSDSGVQAMGERKFRQLAAGNLEAGTSLTIQVKSAGQASEAAGTATAEDSRILNKSYHGGPGNVRLWARYTGLKGHGGLIGVLAFLLLVSAIGAGIYRVVRDRQKAAGSLQAQPAANGSAPAGLLDERRVLIEKLASLDMAFRSSKVSEADYRPRREALKARLVEVTLRLREE